MATSTNNFQWNKYRKIMLNSFNSNKKRRKQKKKMGWKKRKRMKLIVALLWKLNVVVHLKSNEQRGNKTTSTICVYFHLAATYLYCHVIFHRISTLRHRYRHIHSVGMYTILTVAFFALLLLNICSIQAFPNSRCQHDFNYAMFIYIHFVRFKNVSKKKWV